MLRRAQVGVIFAYSTTRTIPDRRPLSVLVERLRVLPTEAANAGR